MKGLSNFSVKGTVFGLVLVLVVILVTATKATVYPPPKSNPVPAQTNQAAGITTPASVNFELQNKEYGLEYLNIKLPKNWQLVTSNKLQYGFTDDKGESVGWITVFNYDPSFGFQRIKPNHASLVKDEAVNTPLGQARLYTMDADNGTAASGITGTHYDYYALISIKDKAIYELAFSRNDKDPETKQLFINILQSLSLSLSGTAVSNASNFDPNYKLQVKVIDKSAPVGAPAKSELWITYSNGIQEKLVSPHEDADATKTIIDIKSLMTSEDKTKVYFDTSAWATSDAVHMVNLITKSEKYVTDGSLLQVIKDGKYKGDLLVEKSKLTDNDGRYSYQAVVDDSGNQIAILSKGN